MPIAAAPLNKPVRVIKILADDQTKKHLESLGIFVDAEVTVLSSNDGNVICKIKDGRLALDKGIALKILISGTVA